MIIDQLYNYKSTEKIARAEQLGLFLLLRVKTKHGIVKINIEDGAWYCGDSYEKRSGAYGYEMVELLCDCEINGT